MGTTNVGDDWFSSIVGKAFECWDIKYTLWED